MAWGRVGRSKMMSGALLFLEPIRLISCICSFHHLEWFLPELSLPLCLHSGLCWSITTFLATQTAPPLALVSNTCLIFTAFDTTRNVFEHIFNGLFCYASSPSECTFHEREDLSFLCMSAIEPRAMGEHSTSSWQRCQDVIGSNTCQLFEVSGQVRSHVVWSHKLQICEVDSSSWGFPT